MQCGIAYGPGRWHDCARTEVEDVLRDLVGRDDLRAEPERRNLQVVIDDVERRRVDPREVDLEGSLRVVDKDARLLELAELTLREGLDARDHAAARVERCLDGRAAVERLAQAVGQRGLRARKLEDLLPLVETRLDPALTAGRADVRDGQDPGLLGGSHLDSSLGAIAETEPRATRRPTTGGLRSDGAARSLRPPRAPLSLTARAEGY